MDIERTQIQPDALTAAAAESAATSAARAHRTIASPGFEAPLDGVVSPVDAAAASAAAAIQSVLATRDTADAAAVSEQTAALTESPPMLVQQDQDNAAAQFPMATMMLPTDSGRV